MVLSIVLPLLVQRWDRKRRGRAPWGFATWAGSLYAFGPFSMLGWSFVTRERWWRIIWGPAWLAALLTVIMLIDLVLALIIGAPIEDSATDMAMAVSAWFGIGVAIELLVELIVKAWRALKRLLRRGAPLLMLLPPAAVLPPGAGGWADADAQAVRGITVGPIENALHPDAGYGTPRGTAAIAEAASWGANWIALTPFGRVWDLRGGGVDLVFEAELAENTRDVMAAVDAAHARGLNVLLVPHLWVETGGWRALIDPGSDAGWQRWAASYRRFLLYWAEVAEQSGAEMLSVGVELRSWVTTARAPSFVALIDEVRQSYGGLLTYSANWDDVQHTVILGELDVIGINAFFPLTKKEGASFWDLYLGSQRVAADLENLAAEWDKPVLLTEMGYTTRVDPALRPWEWPDGMTDVVIDQRAQALAYQALLSPLVDEAWCAGFFVWRTYADPGDVSQEAEWGFSPRGKLAELVVRDAFITRWAADGDDTLPSWLGLHGTGGHRARNPGVIGWEPSPDLVWR